MALIAPASTSPTSSSPLNFFYSANFFLMMGHPNRCCIFKFRPDQREHLIQCLKNGKMSLFPKESEQGRRKLNSYTCKIVKIPVWCFCKMPQCIDNLICCDNRKCRTWYHRICLGLNSVVNEWQCPSFEQKHD